jgi:hypothetical protein
MAATLIPVEPVDDAEPKLGLIFTMDPGERMATSDTVRRFIGAAGGWHDWVFRGFLAFAVIMGGSTALQRARFDRALGRASVCLAQADAGCAGRAVEDARALDADHPRVRLAGLGLHVLLSEVDEARAGLARFKAGELPKNLTPAARGDELLLEGDLAAAAGSFGAAKDHYAAARLLVANQDLVVVRLDRLAQREKRTADDRAALFADINHLIEAAGARAAEVTSLRIRDLSQRISKLGNVDARMKLFLAVAAADRAASINGRSGYAPSLPEASRAGLPFPPVRVDVGQRTAAAERVYQQRLADYQLAVDAYEARRAAAETVRQDRAAAASRETAKVIEEARSLVAEAQDLLDKDGSAPR